VPLLILTQPIGQTLPAGTNFSFSVTATGTPPLRYQWLKNGSNVISATLPSLAFANLTRTNSGSYSVIVSNLASSVASSNAVLKVLVPQSFRAPVLLSAGSILFFSGDSDGGLLTPGDLPNFMAQASTNLLDWTSLLNSLSITNGLLLLQDTSQTNYPVRFYRILEQ